MFLLSMCMVGRTLNHKTIAEKQNYQIKREGYLSFSIVVNRANIFSSLIVCACVLAYVDSGDVETGQEMVVMALSFAVVLKCEILLRLSLCLFLHLAPERSLRRGHFEVFLSPPVFRHCIRLYGQWSLFFLSSYLGVCVHVVRKNDRLAEEDPRNRGVLISFFEALFQCAFSCCL